MKTSVTEDQRRVAVKKAITRRGAGETAYVRDTAEEYGVSRSAVRHWIERYGRTTAILQDGSTGTAALQGIAWCRLCDKPFLARYMPDVGDFYLCLPPCQRRDPIAANVLHDRVVVAVSRPAAAALRRAGGDAPITGIPILIGRVTIGTSLDHMSLTWRA